MSEPDEQPLERPSGLPFPPRTTGAFIAVEGLDGAGTTTQVELVADHLQRLGLRTWTTKEPSTGVLGAAMRLAIEGQAELTPEAMALGFAADRVHHVKGPGGIESRLADGVWVISDRYVLSSLAYQAAQGVDMEWLSEINRFAPPPDVTVFVDTPLDICLERITARGSNLDDVFHTRSSLVATGEQYTRALARGVHLGRLITVDGRPRPAEVAAQIIDGISAALGA